MSKRLGVFLCVLVPVRGFEIRRKITGREFHLPETEGVLIKVSVQDIVQLFIGEVSLYVSPVLFKVIVLHVLRLGYDAKRRGNIQNSVGVFCCLDIFVFSYRVTAIRQR